MLSIVKNYSLRENNSFGVPANCDFYVQVSSINELVNAINYAQDQDLAISVLGGGTNLVLGQHIAGLVIHIQIQGKEIIEETQDTILLRVGAGENWHEFTLCCLKSGHFGLENLALIPGYCGAAPVQNIGAYGIEVSQFIEAVEYYDIQAGELKRISREQCQFGYRDSVFKQSLGGKAVITHVQFKLSKKATTELSYAALSDYINGQKLEVTPESIFNAVCFLRESKLPSPEDIPNAGSFFKNPIILESDYLRLKQAYPNIPFYSVPINGERVSGNKKLVKVPAAWLIDTLGFKGTILDGVGVHDKQALVVINPGHREGSHILAFAKRISSAVHKEFNIQLEIEPQIWGL